MAQTRHQRSKTPREIRAFLEGCSRATLLLTLNRPWLIPRVPTGLNPALNGVLIDPSLPLEHLPSEESGGWLHSLWLHLLPADSSAGLPASTGLHWSTYIPSLPQTVPVFYHPLLHWCLNIVWRGLPDASFSGLPWYPSDTLWEEFSTSACSS